MRGRGRKRRISSCGDGGFYLPPEQHREKEALSFEIHIGDSRRSPPSSSVVIVCVHNVVI